jgi:hypothetical protein
MPSLTDLPLDILHPISQLLASSYDLYRYMVTHRAFSSSTRQREKDTLKVWNSIFRSDKWAKGVVERGLKLVLIQTGQRKRYLYLAVTGKPRITEEDIDTVLDVKALRESLNVPSGEEYEIEFNHVTLNIEGIALPGCPIPVKSIDWLKTGKSLPVYTFPRKEGVQVRRVTPRVNRKNPNFVTLALSSRKVDRVHFQLFRYSRRPTHEQSTGTWQVSQ